MWRMLSAMNAAEATVLSFIIMSLIGGGALMYTEKDRIVQAKVPALETVAITPVDSKEGIVEEKFEEVHVFTQNISYKGEKFIDTWFTAVSALCVTGLISTDFSQFTLPGQIITMVLIQMGGLGIIFFTSVFAILIVRGLSERTTFRSLLASILDTEDTAVTHMIRHIVLYTILFEGLGTLIMGAYLQWFVPASAINGLNPWWWAGFHAVSAFNNAGFGLLNNNLINFVDDPVIPMVIAALIILGGLGYPVLVAIHAYIRSLYTSTGDQTQTELREDVADVVASPVQTRVAIIGTVLLLAIGTFIPLFLDWDNPTMKDHSISQKIMIAFFQSTSTRTAGFNTVDIGALSTATLLLFMLLMYIGANPAGTAGGIKIPTVAVLYGYIKDWFKEPGLPVILQGHRVSKFAVSHAIRLFFASVIFITLASFLITGLESKYLITPDPTFNLTKVLFEIVSAFGTVGLSMGFAGGVTSFSAILSPLSKFIIIVVMLGGRLGLLTILSALPWKRKYANHPLSPDFENAEKIQIG